MKNTIKALVFAVIGFSSVAANAQSHLDLDLSSLDTPYISQLPQLENRKIEVIPGPRFAAVQPTVHVAFTYASCARMAFEAKTQNEENALFVAVELKSEIDCHGLPTKRDYKLQIGSDLIQKQIVVLNPEPQFMAMVPSPKPPTRMCTAIAGRLFNPETGRCVGFSNGCQRADMMASGFVSPKPGQCRSF